MSTVVSDKRASVKSSTAGGRKSTHKPLTFNTYIHKTLNEVHPNINIAKAAGMQLDMFMKIFSARLASLAIQVAHGSGRHTVSMEDVETAVQFILPGELCKQAMEQGQKAVDAFDNSENSEIKNKAARSGLSFPPHISEKFLRLQSSAAQSAASKLRVAQRAPVYMAATIEHLAAEILKLAGEQSICSGRQTITVRHLFLATQHNADTRCLLASVNVSWLGGGVLPYVHPALIPSKEKQQRLAVKRRNARKENGITPTPGSARKALPGTKAIRDMRRYQKSCGLLERKEHFKRFVREQGEACWEIGLRPVGHQPTPAESTVHFGAGVIEYLQFYIEDQVTHIFRAAVRAMLHARRETVEPQDVEFAWSFMRPAGSRVTHTDAGIEHLAQPGLHRLASRGGAKRISQDCYPPIRDIMASLVARILCATFLLMHRQKIEAKTVTLNFLRSGASMVGINLPVDVTRRRPKKNPGSADATEASEREDDQVPLPEEKEELTDDESDGSDDEDSVQ